jgi:exopolysaccharide production protein ExoY
VAEIGITLAERAEWPGKRSVDLLLALVFVLLLLPALFAVGLAVRLSSPGPVLFRQERIGRGGRTFALLKFRTMEHDAEGRLASTPGLFEQYLRCDHKLPHETDPRITPVGRLLRQFSIDELPQLWNVVMGHMSLVGPRPVRPGELAMYGNRDVAYLALRPGLTGLWQVSGRNDIRFPERAEVDADYWRRCGPGLDLRILAATPLAVLSRRGVR